MIDGLAGLLFLLAFLAILAGCAVTVRHDDKRRELDVYVAVCGHSHGKRCARPCDCRAERAS